MTSKRASPTSAASRTSRKRAASPARFPWLAALVSFLVSGAALWLVWSQGWTLWYGDAEAHINIARRLLDSRTPGYEQIGTVWLPLPHLLMMPFAVSDTLWFSGLAGAVPASLCFALGLLLLFVAARRLFGSSTAAWTALLAAALNPNALYLQSTPMTEPFAFCFLCGLAWTLARFHQSKSVWDAAGIGLFALLGTLTRYEFWFLLPFLALIIVVQGSALRWRSLTIFCAVAAFGPAYWLLHNAIFYSNPLEFFNGWWSAKQIYLRALQGGEARHPGDHDWRVAFQYYSAAARLCLGYPLFWLTAAGLAAALWKRAWAVMLVLLAAPLFYIVSLYQGGTPIFVPDLWPNSYYNTRYGLALLPAAAVSLAALASLAPASLQKILAALLVLVTLSPWVAYPRKNNWVAWKESQVNSATRRGWTQGAASYLKSQYRPGAGILMNFGDAAGVLREARIPLKESVHEADVALWMAATSRPDLFHREEWILARPGDIASQTARKLQRGKPRYECVRIYATDDGQPVFEIWRRLS